jgi:LSD1 subclass zinc finger protein
VFAGIAAADTPPEFLDIHRTVRDAFEKQGIDGMGWLSTTRGGNKVFERMYGNFSNELRFPIASASKMVAGLTLLRLIDQGKLALDSTTGQVLGWKGPQAAITLRQLLSFTSGCRRVTCARCSRTSRWPNA